jgi:hypothetical protein
MNCRLGDDFLLNIHWHVIVMAELHCVTPHSARHAGKRAGVIGNLAQGNFAAMAVKAAPNRTAARDFAAAAGQVTVNIANIIFRDRDFQPDNRLQEPARSRGPGKAKCQRVPPLPYRAGPLPGWCRHSLIDEVQPVMAIGCQPAGHIEKGLLELTRNGAGTACADRDSVNRAHRRDFGSCSG